MKMSDHGKELLCQWEGERTTAYYDSAHLLTIGVGHLLRQAELDSGVLLIRGQRVNFHDGLTHQQVLDLLDRDLARFETVILQNVSVDLNQDQFDALVSFVFNVGPMAFENSTLLDVLNDGQYDEVPTQLRRWTRAGGQVVKGLVNRRENEIKLWNGEL